ncbi:MAG: adenylosuccinate synthetase [Candidatus Doudnabacteria bacterium]|nr:adenylosuccinate synthetase [Candidatus Doudnabacteria bacterium]
MNDSKRLASLLQAYQNWAIVGGQWGDEAKGKITDLLAPFFDYVDRYSGGSNAGHTTYVPAGKIVGHLIPSGLAQGKTCIISRGVFFDLSAFLTELSEAGKVLGKLPPIFIDEGCTVRTPWHNYLELWSERARGSKWANTTNRGIGPMASIRAARLDIKLADLYGGKEALLEKLELLRRIYLPIFENMKTAGIISRIETAEEVGLGLASEAAQIKDYVLDTRRLLLDGMRKGQRILFEGAQAALLDATWGTWPYTSSGDAIAGGVFTETGLPPSPLGVAMVVKILPTRVGEGPMPSEIWNRAEAEQYAKDHEELFKAGWERSEFLSALLSKINSKQTSPAEISQYFQVLGDERGSTTGRGRSVGFIDVPIIQYAAEINGPQFLALTKLDTLSGLRSIKVAVAYEFEGRRLQSGELPSANRLHEASVIWEEWPCWTADIRSCRDFNDLPAEAKALVLKLEGLVGIPIRLISNEPSREAIIVR